MTWWEAYQWYCVLCTSTILIIYFIVGLNVQAKLSIAKGSPMTMLRTLYLVGLTLLITLFWLLPTVKASLDQIRENKS